MIQRREKLVALRKNKNLTQKDVVHQLKQRYNIDITESYYGMIEQGVRTPKLEIAIAISKFFNTDVAEIFFEQQHNKMLWKRSV